MAALLAVALLLLCGNVRAQQSDVMGYVTQVRPESSSNQAMAPAITSPTAGSGVMHNAVLANADNDQNIGLALVDLARAVDFKAASPSPAEEPAAPGPESAEPNATGDNQSFAADPGTGGTLLDNSYPPIGSQQDYSGYGVTGSGNQTDPSASGASLASTNATSDDQALTADPSTGGKLLDSSYPPIGSQPGYSGYGVTGAGNQSDPSASGASLASTNATSDDQALTADPSTGGKLLDSSYPPIGSQPGYSGYGVTGAGNQSDPSASTYTTGYDDSLAVDPSTGGKLLDNSYPAVGSQPGYSGYGVTGAGGQGGSSSSGASLASTDTPVYDDSLAADPSTGGKLLDNSYPAVGSQPGYSGYGVTGAGGQGGSSSSGASLASTDIPVYDDSLAADPSTEGKLLDNSYPAVGSQPGYSGYGVTGAGGQGGSSSSGASLASTDTTGYDDSLAADPSTGGKLLDNSYPAVGSQPGYSGYGVTGAGGQGGSSSSGASLASTDTTGYDDSLAADPSTEGKLLDSSYPAVGSQPGYSGYGVTGAGGQGGSSSSGASLASTDIPVYDDSLAADPSTEGKLLDSSYPAISSQPGYSGYGVTGAGGQSDSPPAGAQLASLSSGETRTYAPSPKPAPKSETWSQGNCTFYGGMDAAGTMSGACGYGNLYASGYGAYTAALSSALFKNGMTCGACYEVACSGNAKSCKPGSVLVTVTNFCPPNPGQSAGNGGWCNGANRHFELSYPAFVKIADPQAGVVPLQYRRVPCQKTGGIRYTLNGNCNFNLLLITNVGGSGVVIEAYMKGDGMDWAPMSRSWGANWQCSRNYCGKGISVKIVTSDNKVSVSKLAGSDWAFGKTYIGQQVS